MGGNTAFEYTVTTQGRFDDARDFRYVIVKSTEDGRLITLENVALLPHLGSATVETRQAMGDRCIENLAALLIEGREPPFRVA